MTPVLTDVNGWEPEQHTGVNSAALCTVILYAQMPWRVRLLEWHYFRNVSELFYPLEFATKWIFNSLQQSQSSHNPFLGAEGILPDMASLEDASVKGHHANFSSNICQNSENLLDKTGTVAHLILTVLKTSKKRLCHHIYKKEKCRGLYWAADDLARESLYKVFNGKSKFYCEHSEDTIYGTWVMKEPGASPHHLIPTVTALK